MHEPCQIDLIKFALTVVCFVHFDNQQSRNPTLVLRCSGLLSQACSTNSRFVSL